MDERADRVKPAQPAKGEFDSSLENSPTDKEDDPDAAVQALEEKADSLREELGDLVGEFDKRRHRLVKPLVIAGTAVGGVILAGLIVRQVRQKRPSRLENLVEALQSAATGKRLAPPPSPLKRVLGAAGAAAAFVLARRFARRLIADRKHAAGPIS